MTVDVADEYVADVKVNPTRIKEWIWEDTGLNLIALERERRPLSHEDIDLARGNKDLLYAVSIVLGMNNEELREFRNFVPDDPSANLDFMRYQFRYFQDAAYFAHVPVDNIIRDNRGIVQARARASWMLQNCDRVRRVF